MNNNETLMKKQISYLISALLLLCICTQNAHAQTTNSPKIYSSKELTGTCWEDSLQNQYKQWTVSFTDSMMINTNYYTSSGRTHSYPQLYYLSNSIPQTFDFQKVGKPSYGNFIIGLYKGRLVYCKIIEFTEDKIKIKQPYYGDTLTFVRR